MRSVDQTELAIKNEQVRLKREREIERETWRALLKHWGRYHRARWKNQQGYGKNILNFKNDTHYTNEELERELEKISEAYTIIKDTDRTMALLIIRFYVRESSIELMRAWYGWSDASYFNQKHLASSVLKAIYLTV